MTEYTINPGLEKALRHKKKDSLLMLYYITKGIVNIENEIKKRDQE